MAFTQDEWQAIAGVRSEFITESQARELLSSPSGSCPRIYGLSESGEYANQIVAFKSVYHVDTKQADRYWLSNTTIADLIGRA